MPPQEAIMQTNPTPEQWAVELWRNAQLASFNVLYGTVNKTKDRADRAAALTIQAAFAEREARLVGALDAALEWIDAIPDEVVANLPAMPGFDRDAVDELRAALSQH